MKKIILFFKILFSSSWWKKSLTWKRIKAHIVVAFILAAKNINQEETG